MKPDFDKGNGLIPVIVQDNLSLQTLMLGYMDLDAYNSTVLEKRVTFFSRSKNRLWTKGETSGNYLSVVEITLDCDRDTILIFANASGPTCHNGSISCFGTSAKKGYLYKLERTISDRIDNDIAGSYTNQLFKRGINKVAQKVGEEAVELVIEAKDNNLDLFKNEAADLLYHFLILLKAKETSLEQIENVLAGREKQ